MSSAKPSSASSARTVPPANTVTAPPLVQGSGVNLVRQMRPSSSPAVSTTDLHATAHTGRLGSSTNAVQLRQSLRDAIRNENESILIAWSRLKEKIRTEDRTRDRILAAQEKGTREVPISVQKLIQTMKTNVHKIMRSKGGTPFSIIRQMFLYWDREKTGLISESVLRDCLVSLGVQISQSDIRDILHYYASFSSGGNNESLSGSVMMRYNDLLRDVSVGEAPLTTFIEPAQSDSRLRYEDKDDKFKVQPPIVKDFIEAVRIATYKQMHKHGGTLHSHLRHAFMMSDFDYSNGLGHKEFINAMEHFLGLRVSPEQVVELFKYYDRSGTNEIDYSLILADVTKTGKSILQFDEPSTKHSQTTNVFLPKPFQPKSNKTVECIKHKIVQSLSDRIARRGGTLQSWMKEALTSWDPLLSGWVSTWRQLQGAIRALGVSVCEEEAECLIDAFQKGGSRRFRYSDFIAVMSSYDSSFLHYHSDKQSSSAAALTSRTPGDVSRYLQYLKKKLVRYSTLSQGAVQPRDVLLGSFIKYDTTDCGRLDLTTFRKVSVNLQLKLSDKTLCAIIDWFDTNGSGRVDYRALLKQLFGDDALLSTSAGVMLPASERMSSIASFVTCSAPTRPPALLSVAASNKKSLQASKIANKIKFMSSEKLRLLAKLNSLESQSNALSAQYKLKKLRKKQESDDRDESV